MKNMLIGTLGLLALAYTTVACPDQCQCRQDGPHFSVDCSDQNLFELPDFEDMTVSAFTFLKNSLITF
jgi:hypothetical protein